MYSTNLHLTGDGTMLHSGLDCVGTAYGWETVDKDEEGNVTHVGPATQTAKDNALLWSCAPELVEALAYCVEMLETLCPDTAGTPAALNARVILDKLAHAILPASVTADA